MRFSAYVKLHKALFVTIIAAVVLLAISKSITITFGMVLLYGGLACVAYHVTTHAQNVKNTIFGILLMAASIAITVFMTVKETRLDETMLRNYIVICCNVFIILVFTIIDGIAHYKTRRRVRPPKQNKKSSANDKAGSQQVNQNEYSYEPVIIMADGIVSVLENKGLSDFLRKSFVPKTSFTMADFKDRKLMEEKTQQVFREILRYLELPPFYVRLSVSYDDNHDEQKANKKAGEYQNTPQQRIITLYFKKYYTPDIVLAILCHECTHYFMEAHFLNWKDTSLNEQRTDVTANLIGFNKIMTLGYGYSVDYKIGYILQEDCEMLGRYLKDYQIKHHENIEKDAVLREKKDNIKRLLDTANTFEQQLDILDLKTITVTDQSMLSLIQESLYEYENRDLVDEIEQFRKKAESDNVDELNIVITGLETLCEDMIRWYSAFQAK